LCHGWGGARQPCSALRLAGACLFLCVLKEPFISTKNLYGLKQARIQLPHVVSEAHAAARSVTIKHGKPYAAVVPLQELEKPKASRKPPQALLALRCAGKDLWGRHAGKTLAALRDKWDDTKST
jgi:antitoxin (DNA-binding transcriptional repressor) of toxin-antitoxin stability system